MCYIYIEKNRTQPMHFGGKGEDNSRFWNLLSTWDYGGDRERKGTEHSPKPDAGDGR